MTRNFFKAILMMLFLRIGTTSVRLTATLDAIAAGAQTFEIGTMLAMVGLVPALFALSAGRTLDRIGPRLPTQIALVSMVLAGLISWLMPTTEFGLWPLFVACFLVGTGMMLSTTVIQRLTGDLNSAENRTQAFTVLSITGSLAGTLTPIVVGYIVENQNFNRIYSTVLLVGIGAFMLLFTQAFEVIYPKTKARAIQPCNKANRMTDFFKIHGLRAVIIVSVMISVAWDVSNLLIPVYASDIGLGASEIGWILGSFSAATFAVRVIIPFLQKRMKNWTLIIVTLSVSAFAFFLFPFFNSLSSLMIIAFLMGMGLGGAFPNIMAILYKLAPQGRIGEAIGLRLMMMNASKAVFPIAAGALGSLLGVGVAMLGLSAMLGLGSAYALKSEKAIDKDLSRAQR